LKAFGCQLSIIIEKIISNVNCLHFNSSRS